MTSAVVKSEGGAPALFMTPQVKADRRTDGSIRLTSPVPLRDYARCAGDWLEHWARERPDRLFLGDRASVELPWSTVTYREALKQVRAVGGWILAQRMSAERPLVVLSDNSVDHALFALAAMHVGVPVAAELAITAPEMAWLCAGISVDSSVTLVSPPSSPITRGVRPAPLPGCIGARP